MNIRYNSDFIKIFKQEMYDSNEYKKNESY